MELTNVRIRGQGVLRTYFLFGILEGLLAFVLLMSIPADPKNAVFMGFSTRRIAMALGLLMLVLVFLGLSIKSWKDEGWLQGIIRKLHTTGTDLVLLFLLSLIAFGLIVLGPDIYSSINNTPHKDFLLRTSPIILITTTRFIQTLIVVFLIYKYRIESLNATIDEKSVSSNSKKMTWKCLIMGKGERRLRVMQLIFLIFIFLLMSSILLSRAMGTEFSGDEQAYVAGGRLLADTLLLPYIDYPYLKMPNLVFVYALIFKFTEFSLLGARFISTICAISSSAVLFFLTFDIFRNWHPIIRFLSAVSAALFLITIPLLFNSSKAWNMDLPSLLTLLAFAALYIANRRLSIRWILVCGILLGLAVGTRLTYAIAVFPFILAIFFLPDITAVNSQRNRLLALGFGLLVGLLPTLIFLALSPKYFIYGNFVYHRLNSAFHQLKLTEQNTRITLCDKLNYYFTAIKHPANLTPFLGFTIISIAVVIISFWKKKRINFETGFLIALSLFLLIGALAPTPSFSHYLYAPIPFLILGIAAGLEFVIGSGGKKKWLLIVAFLILFSTNRLSFTKEIMFLKSQDNWVPIRAHNIGKEVKSIIGDGKVLTLTPIFPLEGGVDIYPQFATAHFAWRSAHLLSENERKMYGIISDDELDSLLIGDKPDGILVGDEVLLEEPFINYAKRQGYRPIELSKDTLPRKRVLWILKKE